MKTLFKSYPILSFVILAYIITFFFWFLPAVVSLPTDVVFGIILIGGFGPMFPAYLITAVNSGEKIRIKSIPIFIGIFVAASTIVIIRLYLVNNGMSDNNGTSPHLSEVTFPGWISIAAAVFFLAFLVSNAFNGNLKENFLRSFLYEKGKLKWYIFGLAFFIVLNLSSYFIGKLIYYPTSDQIFNIKPTRIVGILFIFFALAGEEFGWRGFLQKELQKKYNPLVATLVISAVWSAWHLPLYYNGFYSTGGYMEILPRFIWQIPLTIVFTWLYNKSGYSILAVLILHVMNNSKSVFGSSYWPYVVLGLLFCIYCIINDKMWKKKDYHLVYER